MAGHGLDIMWDGYSHREIVEMVSTGPGASLTEVMEDHLKNVAAVLDELSEEVRRVIERSGADWQGGAADKATNAMGVLRGIDTGMHFTSNLAGIRAFGQSDNAEWVRRNMPPVVDVEPPAPTGGLIDILNATVDFQKQQEAAKQAEQRAREIMSQYTASTRERAAAMTPLAPVPQVVLEVATPPRPSAVEPPPRPRDPSDVPDKPVPIQPVQEFDGADESGRPEPTPGPTQPSPTSTALTPTLTQSAATPSQSGTPLTPASSSGSVLPPGGPATTTPPPPAGFVNRGPTGHPGPRPLSESPGRGGGGPAGGRTPTGAPTHAVSAGRGAVPSRGTAMGHGAASPVGVGPGVRPEEDSEHQVKYGIPTAEHFEPDDPVRDPHREGWSVAPPVIGDSEEESDDR